MDDIHHIGCGSLRVASASPDVSWLRVIFLGMQGWLVMMTVER